jgi:hypothetical protein
VADELLFRHGFLIWGGPLSWRGWGTGTGFISTIHYPVQPIGWAIKILKTKLGAEALRGPWADLFGRYNVDGQVSLKLLVAYILNNFYP